jgi:DNA primase
MSTIDFASVKERVSIVDACEKLGIEGLSVHNHQLRGQCPLCDKGNPRSFVVTPAKNLWYSFCCAIGGDQISLVSKLRDMSLRDAAAWLIGDTAPKQVPVPQEQRERSQPLQPLSYLEPGHEAVIAVGFNPKLAEELGIGYAPKGIMRGTVAVPIRDEHGTLKGYIGVTEATLPKDFQLPDNVIPIARKA